jgi:hypothetical protein
MPRQETNPNPNPNPHPNPHPNPNPDPNPDPNPYANPNPNQVGGAEDELIELELTLLRRCTQRVRRTLPLLLLHVAPYLQPRVQPYLLPGGADPPGPPSASATDEMAEMSMEEEIEEEIEGAAALLRAYTATLVARLCPPLRSLCTRLTPGGMRPSGGSSDVLALQVDGRVDGWTGDGWMGREGCEG